MSILISGFYRATAFSFMDFFVYQWKKLSKPFWLLLNFFFAKKKKLQKEVGERAARPPMALARKPGEAPLPI